MTISFVLNGHQVEVTLRGSELLLNVLRDQLGQTGTKEGCGMGECGACSILVDGRPYNACLLPAAEVEGCEVTTVEGLSGHHPDGRAGALSPVQQGFVESAGIQCGFCSPGMIISATALLNDTPNPGEEEIREALIGNLCRCTGYTQIIESVQRAAQIKAGGES